MKPVADIIVVSQLTSYHAWTEAFAAMCSLRKFTLALSAPPPTYESTKNDLNSGTELLSV